MSVISTATSDVAFATSSDVTPSTDNVFYTADGMRYAVNVTSATFDNDANEYYYGYLLIDVNGDKGPNSLTTEAKAPRDTYIATVYGNRVVAGKPGATSGEGYAPKGVLFDKKTN